MKISKSIVADANEAVASVAYRLNEVIAIYPITPASPMGEHCDEWSSQRRPNLWGATPKVIEMQSEAGAAGAVHGSLQAGALTTTFTASQGLLLMIPNLYKIAGELNGFCMHVAARTIATHALSIFCDHSDVMACRGTGVAMLSSSNVQEAQDMAAIGQAIALRSRVPVLHFFDGFRTSHEIARIVPLSDGELNSLIDGNLIDDHRRRALSPEHPVIRGTAQNPDTFFQSREAVNQYYDDCVEIARLTMDGFADITGRKYAPYEYYGHPEAERVLMMMGSSCETAKETVDWLVGRGERVGLINVRLYRPFGADTLIRTLPSSTRTIAVLDRTKEPGSVGEPLYLDVVAAVNDHANLLPQVPKVVGGRYGLSSKELTPSMLTAVLTELDRESPRNHFTVGIRDDVTHRSLEYDEELDVEPDDVSRAVFFGLGSDGTVGANKSSIKIIGEATGLHVQGYFVYDSKKSGAQTVSHLRFGARPIRSAYLIRRAGFVACHHPRLMERTDVLRVADRGATFLLNTPLGPDRVWDSLPRSSQEHIIERGLRMFVIDATRLAEELGLPGRINTIMQVCFFQLAGVMSLDTALDAIRQSIRSTYARKGEEVIRRNLAAVDGALDHLHEVVIPERPTSEEQRPPIVPNEAPDFVKRITAVMMAGEGDRLPVSAFPPDGTWPTGTARWERRNIAAEVPIWEPELCIQCNKCAFVCPHAAIRATIADDEQLADAPDGFRSAPYKAPDHRGLRYVLQLAPEDCTGCNLCVSVCPAKDKSYPRRKAINMQPHAEHVARERKAFDFFRSVPPIERTQVGRIDAKGSQFMLPLFEASGACAGCGETPYIKLLTQLVGDRLMIANATGCSSIYGGNLPTTPYCTDADGRGPAWSNSLFEDNAEFGLGMRIAVDHRASVAHALLSAVQGQLNDPCADTLLEACGRDEASIAKRRSQIARLREGLARIETPESYRLANCIDDLVPRSVWLVGGDGWAYDIGYGGLDHVLAGGWDVKILVLDTEVYSNTGGQQSKATPLGAAAKFAINGKEIHKKDLGLIAMSYGHAYIASVAFGANENQAVRAMIEAESYPGPSLVIAYSHCIAHGYDLRHGIDQQRRAVQCGIWPLYRFDPRLAAHGEPPLQIDSPPIKGSVAEYMANEGRFRTVEKIDRERYRRLVRQAERQAKDRIEVYRQLAQVHMHTRRDHSAPAGVA